MPLLNIGSEEWLVAKAFFDTNGSQTKLSKKSNPALNHSFIKVGNALYAMANKKFYGEEKHAELGRGGFGVVKVVQTQLGENFAVKIEGRDLRGEQEAETLIMKLVKFMIAEASRKFSTEKIFMGQAVTEKLYTVLQLAEGKDLTHHLLFTQNPLSATQQLLLAFKACVATQGLHDLGIIHRDIKPHNMMAKVDGSLIVLTPIDFGLSVLMSPDQEFTILPPLGTPGYVAGEARQGLFSYSSDVFALGAMFSLDFHLSYPELIEGMAANYYDRISLVEAIGMLASKIEASEEIETNIKEEIRTYHDKLKPLIEKHKEKREQKSAERDQRFQNMINAASDLDALHKAVTIISTNNLSVYSEYTVKAIESCIKLSSERKYYAEKHPGEFRFRFGLNSLDQDKYGIIGKFQKILNESYPTSRVVAEAILAIEQFKDNENYQPCLGMLSTLRWAHPDEKSRAEELAKRMTAIINANKDIDSPIAQLATVIHSQLTKKVGVEPPKKPMITAYQQSTEKIEDKKENIASNKEKFKPH